MALKKYSQILILSISIILILPLQLANSKVMRFKKIIFPLMEGVELIYDTKQLFELDTPQEFQSRILFHEIVFPHVHYEWWIENTTPKLTDHGFSTVRGLKTGRVLDPWWTDEPDISQINDRCELWISQLAYDELVKHGHTLFALDVYARKDKELKLTLEEITTFNVKINDRWTILPALKLNSSKGDTLLVYHNRDNPIVLESEISGIYKWTLVKVTIPVPGNIGR